jgi:hypothetical protein
MTASAADDQFWRIVVCGLRAAKHLFLWQTQWLLELVVWVRSSAKNFTNTIVSTGSS